MLKFLVPFCALCLALAATKTVVGIFEQDELSEKAFNFALSRVNSEEIRFESVVDTEILSKRPFEALNKTCSLLNVGPVGIFGPRTISNIRAIQSVCDMKEIPHIVYRWNFRPPRYSTAINFYPVSSLLSAAYVDILDAFEWKTFTILYEDHESLNRISDLMISAKQHGVVVTMEQLDKDGSGDYRPILKLVRDSHQKFFVIDCQIDNLKEVLLQCQQTGLMTKGYHYLLTNLDAHTEDLTPFQHSETFIAGIRIINPDRKYVQDISEELFKDDEILSVMGPYSAWKLQTQAALIIDAVHMFAEMSKKIDSALDSIPMHCNTNDKLEYGWSFINLLRSSTYQGLTGEIKFDHEGYRSDFDLQIYDLKEGGITQIGNWSSNAANRISMISGINEQVDEEDDSMRNKTFIVELVLTTPYIMLKDSIEALYGNDRYEGFCIDLMEELAKMEGFNYTLVEQKDGTTGKKNSDGTWTGLLGDINEGRAHFGITDLTVNSERTKAVDFSEYFLQLGISMLFKKPSRAPPNFFSFGDPFGGDTWIALAVVFLVVTLVFFIIGRMSADEWNNPYPCIEEPTYLVNQFSLANSFWFTIGSIMTQGSEIAPIGISNRLLSGAWCFFILLINASYTANLASFLVSESPFELFTDINSLVENADKYKIRYGAKAAGATFDFFEAQAKKEDANPVYKRIYDHMISTPEDMPLKNEDGVALADSSGTLYAFFMESTSITYETERHCNLKMVGPNLDNKGYGIAMQKNFKYRTRISAGILKLHTSGFIEETKRKWWEQRRGGGHCLKKEKSSDAEALELENVEGVFFVTIYGTILAVFLVVFEHTLYLYRASRKSNIPLREVFMTELKHYINFNSNVKPAIRSPESSKSENGSVKSKSKSQTKSKSSSNCKNRDLSCNFYTSDERLSLSNI